MRNARTALPGIARGLGIAMLRITQFDHFNTQACAVRKAGNQITITAVVARSTEHHHTPCLRPLTAKVGKCRGRGAAHQLKAADAQIIDRAPVDRAYLLDGV